MKIEVTIEKSKDGLFAVYPEKSIENFYPIGYGDSVKEAFEDFDVSIEEMNEMRAGEGLPPIKDLEIEPKFDIESFFNNFDFLNISKVADRAGINPSLMRQYASGLTKAGRKQYEKISAAVSRIAADLAAVQF